MDQILNLSFSAGIIALVTTFLSTFFVIRLAKRMGIIDDPKKHKHPKVIHTYPVPRGGGLAIFAGILLATLAFLPFDKHLKGILAGALVITIVGFLDDKYDLNPYFRLFAQFLAASLPIAAGIGIAFLSNPFNGVLDLSQPQINFHFLGEARSIWVLSDAFALFWIVFLMNILNMGAKGIDGQLPGIVTITAIIIAAFSLRFSADITQWPVIILAGIIAGSYLGFLPWNIYPQKIMPSFGGSNLAGYFLAILSILATAKVGTLFVVLGVPLIDTGYTIARRIASKRSPVWGDRGHLHHKLFDAGLSKRQVSLFYWLATLFLGLAALHLNSFQKIYTIIGVAIAIGGLLLWLTYQPKS